jgi:hypothetical protein
MKNPSGSFMLIGRNGVSPEDLAAHRGVMSEAIVIVVIVSATTLAVVGFGVGIYNRLIRSQVQTREAWSGIDVQLRRRTSLAPNLVESVRGYAVHERSVFDETHDGAEPPVRSRRELPRAPRVEQFSGPERSADRHRREDRVRAAVL